MFQGLKKKRKRRKKKKKIKMRLSDHPIYDDAPSTWTRTRAATELPRLFPLDRGRGRDCVRWNSVLRERRPLMKIDYPSGLLLTPMRVKSWCTYVYLLASSGGGARWLYVSQLIYANSRDFMSHISLTKNKSNGQSLSGEKERGREKEREEGEKRCSFMVLINRTVHDAWKM